MGREQRRREERKNKNIKKQEKIEELDTSIKGITVLKVVFLVILILFVVYYILAVFITKEVNISNDKKNDTNETTTESSNKILAANIFNQTEEKYYVYCYDFNDEDDNVKDTINSVQDFTIYRVNTSDGLNKNYVSETGNKEATNLENLKVSNPTLLVIEGDRITGYYEGRTSIMSFLGG